MQLHTQEPTACTSACAPPRSPGPVRNGQDQPLLMRASLRLKLGHTAGIRPSPRRGRRPLPGALGASQNLSVTCLELQGVFILVQETKGRASEPAMTSSLPLLAARSSRLCVLSTEAGVACSEHEKDQGDVFGRESDIRLGLYQNGFRKASWKG